MLVTMANLAAEVWDQPDNGIWEMRDRPRHHLYSKLMCWIALDRAIGMANDLKAEDRVEDWSTRREEIRRAMVGRSLERR